MICSPLDAPSSVPSKPKPRCDLGGPYKTRDHWPNRSHSSFLELSSPCSWVAGSWGRGGGFPGIFYNDCFEKNLLYEVNALCSISG